MQLWHRIEMYTFYQQIFPLIISTSITLFWIITTFTSLSILYGENQNYINIRTWKIVNDA